MRLARRGDVAAMQQLVRQAYQPYVARIGRPPAPMSADYALIVAAGTAWVAEEDAHLLGLIVLVPAGDHLLLDNVAVAPAAQGLGIGARLLRLAEERARAQDLREVRLYTNEAMSENLAYYPRHGYAETHRATEAGYRRVYFTKPIMTRDHPPPLSHG